jgi:hypothetical protein
LPCNLEVPIAVRNWLIRFIVLTSLCGGSLLACSVPHFLTGVTLRPSTISPNADGKDDIAEIHYTLSRQANITIYLVDQAGTKHYFRSDKRRSKGDRTAYFGGVIDGRLLPDGAYTCVLEAVDERGRKDRVESPLKIVDGDKVYMAIENFSIYPHKFTPNRDGITDRVTISYFLNKEAQRVDAYLLGADGVKYPIPPDKIRKPGTPGAHEHDYDAGIDLGATPPQDGDYTVVVEAEDVVGNQARAEGQLTIEGGGVPLVQIVNSAAEFSPTVLPLGAELTFTCTVQNVGRVPVRTKGPESGTTYSTSENFNTLKQYEEPGIFRIGLDFEGNSEGRLYPFRWQLGQDSDLTTLETEIGPQKYLMPGQSVTVTGHLRIADRPVKVTPYYWLGLIHEQVWIVQDRVEPTQISIGY